MGAYLSPQGVKLLMHKSNAKRAVRTVFEIGGGGNGGAGEDHGCRGHHSHYHRCHCQEVWGHRGGRSLSSIAIP